MTNKDLTLGEPDFDIFGPRGGLVAGAVLLLCCCCAAAVLLLCCCCAAALKHSLALRWP